MAFKDPSLSLTELKAISKLKSAMKGTRTKVKDGKVISSEVPPMVDKKEIQKKMEETPEYKKIKKKFEENKKKYGN